MRTRGIIATAFVPLASMLVLACSTNDVKVSEDAPDYGDVTSLKQDANLVVEARRGELIAKERDQGQAPSDAEDEEVTDPGIPMAFYEFEVRSVLRGQARDERIVVGLLDADQEPDMRPVDQGSDNVLFLIPRTAEETPGIESVGEHYVPVSGQTGMFDVAGDQAVPRDAHLTRLEHGGEEQLESGSPAFALEDLREAVGAQGE